MILKHAKASCLCVLMLLSTTLQPALAIPVTEASTARPGKVIDLGGLKPFKKSKKVFVPGYRVGFVTRVKVTAHAENFLGGGFGASGSKASMEGFLSGVDYATMQASVDAAYDNFLKQLKDAGLEVVSLDTMTSNATFKQLETSPSSPSAPYLANILGNQSIVVSPSKIPLWFMNWDKAAGGPGKFSGDNYKLIGKLAEELGATAIYPFFILDFASTESSGNSKFARRASVGIAAKMSVVANSSFWTQANAKDAAFGKYTDWVVSDAELGSLDEMSKADNETMVKAWSGAGVNIGPVSGKKNVILHADPAKFKSAATQTLTGATEVLKTGIMEVRK